MTLRFRCRPLLAAAVVMVAGCSSDPTDHDTLASGPALSGSSVESTVAADCPSPDDFQAICACDDALISWESLDLPADQAYSQIVTAFMEGSAESVAEAACAQTLGRKDVVDAEAYELSGRSDGSTTVGLNLASRDELVGYSFLSDADGHPLGFAYFVVQGESEEATVVLTPWEGPDASAE